MVVVTRRRLVTALLRILSWRSPAGAVEPCHPAPSRELSGGGPQANSLERNRASTPLRHFPNGGNPPTHGGRKVGGFRAWRVAVVELHAGESIHIGKGDKMDSRIIVQVFQWRDALHCTVDVAGPHGRRRYAPRRRLQGWTAEALPHLQGPEALEWAITVLNLWMNQGFELSVGNGGVAVPAPPGGGHGGRRVAPGVSRSQALPSQTTAPPVEHRGAVGVSDGLQPPGAQGVLF